MAGGPWRGPPDRRRAPSGDTAGPPGRCPASRRAADRAARRMSARPPAASASQHAAASLADRLLVADEVRAALAEGRPIVALESTLITHGLPHPQNLEVALAAEAAVRAEGAIPATVAIQDGRLRVGLSAAEL